jgi:hypothetical protein
MRANRRNVMALLAASAIAPGIGACTPAPDPAAAWRNPGAGESDPRRFALAHAILAPNPHNRQPWLVELVGADELLFYADLDRLLPETDPFDRQIVLGCGAFLEVFKIALSSLGKAADVTPWPDGEPTPRLDARPIAHIRIREAMKGHGGEPIVAALFSAITRRRTNRKPFEDRAIEADKWPLLRSETLSAAPGENEENGLSFGWADGGALRDALRALAWSAFEKEFRTPHAHLETVNLLRVGRKEIAEHRDGIAVQGMAVEIARTLGLVNKGTLADIDNAQTRDGLMAWRPLALDAPAFVWINSDDNSRATQIIAGGAYARLNLAATKLGLSMHPWSQALQEYPEMAQLHAEAERLLGAPNEARVQMLARIGYGPEIPPAPRRGLREHVRT